MVVLEDVGCAAMRAGAALWAAATSAAATAGRMEGMSSGCRLRAGGWRGPSVTWRCCRPFLSAAVGGGGAGLRSPPSGLGWACLRECVTACASVSAGCNSSRGLHLGAGGFGPGVSGMLAGGVCGYMVGLSVPWGLGLLAADVCGLLRVRGGEGRSAGGCVAGVCGLSGRSVRAVSRGLGLRALLGVFRPLGGEWGGRGRDGGRVEGCGAGFACVVSVYLSACSGAPVRPLVGREVWRRSWLSSADFADKCAYLVDLLVGCGERVL